MQILKQAVSITLLTTLFFGGGYWFYTALAGCDVPISYRIGTVDERFHITDAGIRNAISTAESLWEDGTDRNLFTYDPKGTLVVNFVYDERQKLVDEQKEYEGELEKKENVSENVKSEYEKLVAEYEKLRVSYETQVDAYEKKLTAYNKEVAEWNEKGGAPKDVFERLEKTKKTLATEEKRLGALSNELNALVKKINNLSNKGNSIVSDYNSLVNEYNSKFAEGEEFTQGDYKDDVINVYEFGSDTELSLVLAHELGHALDIDHVGGETSIMYHHMNKQSLTEGLTEADRTAFGQSCGDKGNTAYMLQYLRKALEDLLRRYTS